MLYAGIIPLFLNFTHPSVLTRNMCTTNCCKLKKQYLCQKMIENSTFKHYFSLGKIRYAILC